MCACNKTDNICSTIVSEIIDARGALLSGPPSLSTCAFKNASPAFARNESGLPVTEITLQPFFFIALIVALSSTVSPLLDIAITTSPGTSCPALPWTHSVPWRKYVGVPVEDNNDAI